MRKLILSALALMGLLTFGAATTSANPAFTAMKRPAAGVSEGVVKAGWRHRHHGFSVGIGWGYPRYYGYRYYGYPRYSYYDDYTYYRPRVYYYRPAYSTYRPHHHKRRWCNRHDRWEW